MVADLQRDGGRQRASTDKTMGGLRAAGKRMETGIVITLTENVNMTGKSPVLPMLACLVLQSLWHARCPQNSGPIGSRDDVGA